MKFLYVMICCGCLLSCKSKTAADEEAGVEADSVRTPVTVTTVTRTELKDEVELNATSAFQQSNIIKSPANGYLQRVAIKLGERVSAGQFAFAVQTKEAHALGNTINKLDPSFHFDGMIQVKASTGGYIQSLDHQAGDYVQDGEQLATLADLNSFGFILNLPVEYRALVSPGNALQVDLPDGRHLNGKVTRIMPNVDSVSQTQQVFIHVNDAASLPQNLIAKVKLVKAQKNGVITLPKAAVLTDDSQTDFWVMKMIDSVTAVKVPIVKGMETTDRVEVVRPEFNNGDRILLSGNYGLSDTAKVRVMKAAE